MADKRTGRPYRTARAKLKRRGQVCYLCGQPIDPTLKHPDPMSFSAHHVTPYAHGGTNADLVGTHLVCNQRQSDDLTPRVDRHSQAWY